MRHRIPRPLGAGAVMRSAALLAAVASAAVPALRAQSGTGTGPVLAFTVTDSALRGPAAFTAGVVTIQLVNRGRQVHVLQLLQITGGHTADEAKAYIVANDAPPRDWSVLSVGVGPVESGQTIAVTLKLDAGTYLMLDPLADPHGRTNFFAGIVAPFPGSGAVRRDLANIPAAAGLMITNRFRFGNLFRTGNTWTQSESRNRNTEMRPGLQTIRIETFATGLHSVVLARGGPEVMRQYVEWLNRRRPTPPAGLVGGVIRVPNGSFNTRAFLQVRLAPGGYIFFCPERDPNTGLYGYEAGETTQFSVR